MGQLVHFPNEQSIALAEGWNLALSMPCKLDVVYGRVFSITRRSKALGISTNLLNEDFANCLESILKELWRKNGSLW